MKFVAGITRKITKRLAESNKNKFSQLIKKQPYCLTKEFPFLSKKDSVEIDLVSFSCSRDVEEQVLSILSFVRYAGIPSTWTICSDGTHTESDKELLQSIGTFVQLKKWDASLSLIDTPQLNHLITYSTKAPLGKKLISFLSYKMNKKTIFLDSDILFYTGIKEDLKQIIQSDKNWFTPEEKWGTVDTRYTKEFIYQVNSGFSILTPSFKWEKSIEFIASLEESYEYFSEQTSVHIAITSQNSYPLDPRKYVLHAKDQFTYNTKQNNAEISMRHFISPIRHKMWQQGYKWHLGL